MDKFEQVTYSKRKIFVNNLIGGIAWAIGASFGFSILVAIVSFVLSQVNVIPFIGGFALQISQFMEANGK